MATTPAQGLSTSIPARSEPGKPVSMRRLFLPILCATLLILSLSAPAETAAAPKKILNLCTLHFPSDERVEWDCRRLKRGETAEKLFGDYWEDVLRFNRVDRRHLNEGVSIKVPKNIEDVVGFSPMPLTWSEAAEEEKFILVDQTEQFLGAYEFGRLTFSLPIATGDRKNKTPTGMFKITAFDRWHSSSLYQIEDTQINYPMHFGLRFHISANWVSYWIHGRDVPGYPASHGCIGLYDEEMQKRYYGIRKEPVLMDARRLYEWAISSLPYSDRFTRLKDGPRIRIIGEPPI